MSANTELTAPLMRAVKRIFGPLARMLIARGVRYQSASNWLKEAYFSAAFQVAGTQRPTDSRLSMLTGLQRKDVKAIRSRLDAGAPGVAAQGPIPRLIQNWRTMPLFRDASGMPAALPRSASDGPSFDALAATVSTDIHPRTVLDEMLRLGLVSQEPDSVTLLVEAFIPGADQAALVRYLGDNLGDHAEAATRNILSEGSRPFFERAVHYNRMSADALSELDALARTLQQSALEQIAARAAELQDRDGTDPDATGRFRCGAFILTAESEQQEHRS